MRAKPPSAKKRRGGEIRVSSVRPMPKRSGRSKGEVSWFDRRTGRGLIAPAGGGNLIHFHRPVVAGGWDLKARDAVEFRVSLTDVGTKMAIDVTVTGRSGAGDVDGCRNKVVIEISSDEEEDCDFSPYYAEDKQTDGDDCCILDFDPFRPAEDDSEKKLTLSGRRLSSVYDQDISVVAERGEVACRDFPHSRHLCAKYPFSKTAHESCCLQCYCYVCDVAAPCKYWKGTSGHCHASDLDDEWKNKRKAKKSTSVAKVRRIY